MAINKLPVLGTFFANQVALAGLAGTTYTGTVVAPAAQEVTISRFALSGATIVLDGVNATVTLASHLNTIVGQQVTFSGATGVTAINNQTWTIGSIVSANSYTFPCTLVGTVTGTIVQEPVFSVPAGFSFMRLGANAIVEYCPDNSYNASTGNVAGQTWRTLLAASTNGAVPSDGFAVRMRCSGTTASSTLSLVG
jgi:hypothetical protein